MPETSWVFKSRLLNELQWLRVRHPKKKKGESDSDDVPRGKPENLLDANDPTDVPAPAE